LILDCKENCFGARFGITHFLGILCHVEFLCFSIPNYVYLCWNSVDLLKTILSSVEANNFFLEIQLRLKLCIFCMRHLTWTPCTLNIFQLALVLIHKVQVSNVFDCVFFFCLISNVFDCVFLLPLAGTYISFENRRMQILLV
jgi:hypothetical protein